MEAVGNNILIAIKKRGLKREDVAEMSMLSLPTLRKVLKGDPTVGFGCYVAVLDSLGLAENITHIANPKEDEVGMALSEKKLAQRIKTKKSKYEF